jgi:hypothetical protein
MSAAEDASEAGRAAASAAMLALDGQAPALVIVYAWIRYDLPALLAAVRQVTGQAVLVGATSAGHFASGVIQPIGRGVVVLALTAGAYRFGVASAQRVSSDLDGTGQRLARESRAAAGAGAHGAILLLTDWQIGDQQQLIQGLYRVTGPRIPTVGGAAGDTLELGPTLVFHNDAVLEQGAVAVWIASDSPLKVVTRHGWEAVGTPLLVGRVEGTHLEELGGKPAALAYQEQLGLGPDALADNAEFVDVTMRHPLGILQADGSLLVRALMARTPGGGLVMSSQVPAGCALLVTTSSADRLLDCIQPLVKDVLAEQPAAGVLLAFSCIARFVNFGERAAEEPKLLQEAAGSVPTFGFYSYAEYGRTRGVLGTHNATITALAL